MLPSTMLDTLQGEVRLRSMSPVILGLTLKVYPSVLYRRALPYGPFSKVLHPLKDSLRCLHIMPALAWVLRRQQGCLTSPVDECPTMSSSGQGPLQLGVSANLILALRIRFIDVCILYVVSKRLVCACGFIHLPALGTAKVNHAEPS